MSVDRGSIDEQLRDIGESDRWWEHREFRELPHVLSSDERIHGIITGKLLGPRRLPFFLARPRLLPTRPWLIVATDQRLICLRQERFGRKQVDIRLGQIAGIQHGSRIRTYQITLHVPEGIHRIRVRKSDAFRFVGALAPLIPRPAVRPSNAQLAAPSWLPGVASAAGMPGLAGLVSKVSMLTAPDYAARGDVTRVETTVERMESELGRLQQQVDFLEQLLQERADAARSLPASSPDS